MRWYAQGYSTNAGDMWPNEGVARTSDRLNTESQYQPFASMNSNRSKIIDLGNLR